MGCVPRHCIFRTIHVCEDFETKASSIKAIILLRIQFMVSNALDVAGMKR
jgi:hypothetical protein